VSVATAMAQPARNVLTAALVLLAPVAQAQEETIRVGSVRSTASLTTTIAIEKGYFREAGIKVELTDLDTSTDSLAVVAQNRLQIVGGGLSAAFFNAVEKNLPVTVAFDRVSSPLGHKLLVRSDLKDQIKSVAALKGRPLASNSRGSITNYEIGKILKTVGLGFRDVDLKFLPFSQVALAFANKAIDAAIAIPPFTAQLLEGGHAVDFKSPDDLVTPHPLTIAVSMVNTDWAKANQQLLRNYYVAYLRGIRDYCQAYHGGAIRREMIDLSIRTGTETRSELLHKYPWPARSPNGRINIASMLDMQAWYRKSKMSNSEFPADRIVDKSYVDHAMGKLGPFVLENKDSTLAGCR